MTNAETEPTAETVRPETNPTERADIVKLGGEPWSTALVGRCVVGGVFMGAANLVPGISGGTMLVAVGVYRRFVSAVADVARLKFNARSIGTIALIVLGAALAFVGLAKIITLALQDFRWGMYALFIGLTLGGVPLLWGMLERRKPAAWGGVSLGFAIMTALTFLQAGASATAGGEPGMLRLFIGGVAGASAMILPGVSGAYLLLLLGLYETIITAIKDIIGAVSSLDFSAAVGTLRVLVPVGLGVVVGLAVVSSALKWLLKNATAPTIGCLLGLLLASPLGLYPFREAIKPAVGDVIAGVEITEANLNEALDDPKDWPQRSFTPDAGHLLGASGLIALGFLATLGIARLGRGSKDTDA